MKTSGKWHRHVRCFALGIVAAAVCGEGVADVMPLPKTEHNLAAFFRFDTESAWGADAGPNGSSLSAKSGNAAYLAADGCLASGALNLPYAAKTTSSAGNTYTSSTVSGTFGSAEVVPDLSSMTKGWTLAFWFKADPEMMDQKIHSKASFRTILEQFAKAGVTDDDLNVFAAIVTNGVWNHIAVAFNPERYAAGKDAYSLFVNCGGVGGTGNRVDGSFPEGGTASCPLYLPVAISGTSLTLGGDFGLKFATPRDLGSYGTLNELKLTLQGTVDDIACVNRNLTTNEITRLASTGETYVFLTKSTASFDNYPYWSSQWGYMKPVPHVGSDYLVDSGFTLSTSNLTSYTASFGGDSLTLGRFGGTAGNLKIQSTTADVTVGDLRANNGKIQVASSTATLRGAVSVNGTDASPFVVETAGNNATRLTWKSSLSGAAGSCLKVAAGSGKGALDVTFDCDATGFRGTILADGASTTLRVSRATLQSMGAASRPNAIKLTNGAKLASFGDEGLVFETSATSGKFSEVAWTPATPVGGAGVELVFTGANFSLENDIEDLAFSKLNFAAKGTLRGKRLKATAAAAGHDAILYFGAQGAAITAPLYLADNLTVTNNLNPTISGYTKINGVDGDISGPGRLTFWCAHRLHAQGYISLFGRNTFSGGLDVQLGNVVPTNVVALGTGKVYCTNETASVNGAANYARLWLRNFAGVGYTQTLTNEVFVGSQLVNVSNTARFQTDGNFNFTDTAVLHAVSYHTKINGYGMWTLKKGIDATGSTSVVWEVGGNDNNVAETPLDMPSTELLAGHQNANNQSAIRFKVAGNRVGSLSAYKNAVFAFDVDNAFSVAPNLEPMDGQTGMIVELNGTTQTFGSHVDGSSHAPLLIRNSNANKSATVTLKQNTANRNSSLTISGPMTFVKDGTSTLTTAKGFWVNGDLVVRNGMLQLYGAVSNHLAKTVSVEGGELDLGGGLFTCGKLQLKGGRISNGTLVCTECAEIEAGESTAEIIGTVVKKGAGAASVYTARRAARGGDGPPTGTVFYMAFDDPNNIGKVTVGGADPQAEREKIPSYQAAGVFGGCAYFDGAQTALSSKNVGYPTGLPKGAEPYTVSAWICVSNGCSTSGSWIAYRKASAKGLGNNFRLTNTSDDIWNYWHSMDVRCPATDVRDGKWHHVVGAFDGTTRKIYYDGALGISDSTMTPNIGTDLLLVGRTLNDVYLKGCIDEVLILNRAATDAEVHGLFLQGRRVGPQCGERSERHGEGEYADRQGRVALLSAFIRSGSAEGLQWQRKEPDERRHRDGFVLCRLAVRHGRVGFI